MNHILSVSTGINFIWIERHIYTLWSVYPLFTHLCLVLIFSSLKEKLTVGKINKTSRSCEELNQGA
jgi:hypothetical protein